VRDQEAGRSSPRRGSLSRVAAHDAACASSEGQDIDCLGIKIGGRPKLVRYGVPDAELPRLACAPVGVRNETPKLRLERLAEVHTARGGVGDDLCRGP